MLRDAEMAPTKRTLAEILERLPSEPGVYIMKDRRGKIIYIGKAANLRNARAPVLPARQRRHPRLRAAAGRHRRRHRDGRHQQREGGAAAREHAHQAHQPRFNVKLTDDKNYLVLRLDPRARLAAPRGRAQDGRRRRALLRPVPLGDLVPRGAARREPPLPAAHLHRSRAAQPQAPLPAVPDQALPRALRARRCRPSDYGEQVRDVRLFLDGKNDELLERLRPRMKDAAGRTEFELAAAVRDQMRALEALEEQRVVSDTFVDQDVFGFHREGIALEIVVLFVRQGKLVGNRAFSFGKQEFPDAEILSTFVGLYYDLRPPRPTRCCCPSPSRTPTSRPSG